jgi:hypothetical protein
MLEHFGTPRCAQPIAGAESELLDSFHPADPRSQFRAEQSSVSSFVRESSHRCKLLVDGVGGQMPRFQVHAIAHDHDAVEGQPRLGAIPGDELVDCVLVHPTRSRRAEAVKNGGLTVIQIRQAQHSATVIRLDSVFAHDDGLPVPRHGITANCPHIANRPRVESETAHGSITNEIKTDLGRRED